MARCARSAGASGRRMSALVSSDIRSAFGSPSGLTSPATSAMTGTPSS